MTPQWINPRDALHREIAALRVQLEESQERERQLRAMLFANVCVDRWRFTAQQEAIFLILATGRLVTREQMLHAIYGDEPEGVDETGVVDVQLMKVRRKVAADGILIETFWGRGYKMPAASVQRVRELCAPATMQVAA